MQARMNHPAMLVPDAMQALQALSASTKEGELPVKTGGLVEVRASQINGCSVCVDGHTRLLRKEGESDERMLALSAWRDAPYFSGAERAALALAESVTRLADREDPVPDHIWDEVTRHYDEAALADLLLTIASINVWNRLNVSTRQPAGIWTP